VVCNKSLGLEWDERGSLLRPKRPEKDAGTEAVVSRVAGGKRDRAQGTCEKNRQPEGTRPLREPIPIHKGDSFVQLFGAGPAGRPEKKSRSTETSWAPRFCGWIDHKIPNLRYRVQRGELRWQSLTRREEKNARGQLKLLRGCAATSHSLGTIGLRDVGKKRNARLPKPILTRGTERNARKRS